MTHDAATARCAQLNRDEVGERQWFTRQTGDGDWEVVSVRIAGFRRRDPLKASIETKPRPAEPPDPRPAIFRNIPPFGPG